MFLAGWECFVKLPNGSCLNSRNLTNDPSGLQNRTDEEIKNMFLNGMRPAAAGGTALNPAMPYYVFHNMSDADANAIVAYLRTVPGVVHNVPKSGPEFAVPAPATPLDPNKIPLPLESYPQRESALRGRYLASEAGICIECHTKHNPPGSPEVIDSTKFFAGGEPFDFGFPELPVSLNLTSDATGLATWTTDDIIKVLHMGIDKMGKGICPPMPVGPMGAFGGLTDADALDIANYIKSLPPIANAIVDMCSFPFPPPPDGGGTDAVSADAGAADATTD
jgi:mono/diheme cytochrome c family protein